MSVWLSREAEWFWSNSEFRFLEFLCFAVFRTAVLWRVGGGGWSDGIFFPRPYENYDLFSPWWTEQARWYVVIHFMYRQSHKSEINHSTWQDVLFVPLWGDTAAWSDVCVFKPASNAFRAHSCSNGRRLRNSSGAGKNRCRYSAIWRVSLDVLQDSNSGCMEVHGGCRDVRLFRCNIFMRVPVRCWNEVTRGKPVGMGLIFSCNSGDFPWWGLLKLRTITERKP
jgi:hypothetical protein